MLKKLNLLIVNRIDNNFSEFLPHFYNPILYISHLFANRFAMLQFNTEHQLNQAMCRIFSLNHYKIEWAYFPAEQNLIRRKTFNSQNAELELKEVLKIFESYEKVDNFIFIIVGTAMLVEIC